jgi:hypothetical protein
MTSSYKLNNVPLSSIVQYITDTTRNDAFGSANLTLKTDYTSKFASNINERPNNTNYKYKDTDISSYCIAPWKEGTSTETITAPSWCTKIRAVLVGGGGGGGNGQASVSSINNYHFNMFSHHNQDWDVFYPGLSGGGGGGGGFVYIADTALTGTLIATVGGGGGANTGGQYSVIQMNSQNLIVAYGGSGGANGSGTNGAGGAGGSTQGGYIAVSGAAGSNGGSITGGNAGNSGLNAQTQYASSLTYGNGGKGGDAGKNPYYAHNVFGGTQTDAQIAGQGGSSGTSGYYRIYYLTN